MPERYGSYDDTDGQGTDVQFVGCVQCEKSIDLFDTHPMWVDEQVTEVGDVQTRVYHFCSGDCLAAWKRERDVGE